MHTGSFQRDPAYTSDILHPRTTGGLSPYLAEDYRDVCGMPLSRETYLNLIASRFIWEAVYVRIPTIATEIQYPSWYPSSILMFVQRNLMV